jgi:hypothetical protein
MAYRTSYYIAKVPKSFFKTFNPPIGDVMAYFNETPLATPDACHKVMALELALESVGAKGGLTIDQVNEDGSFTAWGSWWGLTDAWNAHKLWRKMGVRFRQPDLHRPWNGMKHTGPKGFTAYPDLN